MAVNGPNWSDNSLSYMALSGLFSNALNEYMGGNKSDVSTIGSTSRMAGRMARIRANGQRFRLKRGYKRSRNNRFMGRGMINATELKFVDNTSTYNADTAGTAIQGVNFTAQGLDVNNRIGRRILMTSMQLKGILYVTGLAGGSPIQMVNLSVVYDKQCDGAVPTVSGTAGIYAGNLAYDLVNGLNGKNRFTVLFNRSYVLTPYAASSAINSGVAIDEYIKLGLIAGYDGTAANVASIETGGIYVVVRGTIGAGAGAGQMILNTRIRFSNHQ